MKITAIEPIAVAEPGGRKYVIVRMRTDGGVTGYGETRAEPDPKIAVESLRQELRGLVGQDPTNYIRLDQQLQRRQASSAARAAVNLAAFDVLGKSCRSPLYELLGGPTRHKARAMVVISSTTPEEQLRAIRAAKQVGHRAFSIPLKMPIGMERGRAFYAQVRRHMDGLRQAVGEDCDFVLDCDGATTPSDAVSIADRMEDFHLLWLDEPVADINVETQAGISRRTSTPLGTGRHVTENARFQEMLRESAIDVLRPDIALQGISAIRKAAAIAETYYVAVAPYQRGGPIATAAGIHIAASLANSFIQETPFSLNEADRRMRKDIAGGWDEAPEEGFFALLNKPGLGIDIQEAAIERFVVAK